MPRDDPLDPPPADAARAAAEHALDEPVAAAVPIEEGLNAVYRVDLARGDRAVLKAATLETDAEVRPEPRLLARLARETPVPAPDVLAAVPPAESPLGVAYFVAEFRAGRTVPDLLALSPGDRERLVREAGRHLAGLHGLDVADGFGPLRVAGNGGGPRRLDEVARAPLTVRPRHDSWPARFAALAADAADGLAAGGFAADDEPRFPDLGPVVRRALADPPLPDDIAPAALHADYRPANLLVAPGAVGGPAEGGSDAPVTRAVLDVAGHVGDGRLDLALAEDALVSVPLGGTDEADRLRSVLRRSYAAARGLGLADAVDERYPYYRLYARARRLRSFDYWVQFAHEADPDAVERRWRSLVADLVERVT